MDFGIDDARRKYQVIKWFMDSRQWRVWYDISWEDSAFFIAEVKIGDESYGTSLPRHRREVANSLTEHQDQWS